MYLVVYTDRYLPGDFKSGENKYLNLLDILKPPGSYAQKDKQEKLEKEKMSVTLLDQNCYSVC